MSVVTYWISKTFVVEWKLVDLAGAPVAATVAGTVTKPDQTTAAMTVANPAVGTYRLSYDTAAAGLHAWRATATGAADDAAEGDFYVRPSLAGAAVNTYDPTTDRGKVRLLIPDTDVHDPERVIYSDAEIDALLALENSNVRLAAAAALDAIASNEALVSKKIKTQDLSTDGPAVAKELRERAIELRRQVAEGDADDTGGFHVVDFDPSAWLSAAELAE